MPSRLPTPHAAAAWHGLTTTSRERPTRPQAHKGRACLQIDRGRPSGHAHDRAPSSVACRTPKGGAYDYAIAVAVRTQARLWLPVVIWAAVIFAFSSIPSLSTGLGTWDLVLRKLAHGAEYAILGGLLYRWLSSVPLAILAGSGYAATDELHQSFVPGRAGLVTDWLIDTAAVVIGVFLLLAWRRRR